MGGPQPRWRLILRVPITSCSDSFIYQAGVLVSYDILGVNVGLDFQISPKLLILTLQLTGVSIQNVANHFPVSLILIL